MKWVHRKAINILRPPSCSIFHARNHGTILLLKLCNPIIQMIKKTHFFKNEKKLQNSRAKKKRSKIRAPRPPRGGGLDAGAHDSPRKIELEAKIRAPKKNAPKFARQDPR